MVWPNNYRTFPGWIQNKLYGRQDYGSYKMGMNGDRFNRFINENIPKTTATPTGYYSPVWQVPPIKSGGLSSYLALTGQGNLSADVLAVRLALADLAGSGTLSADGSLIVQLIADLIGNGGITDADLKAFLAAVAGITGTGDITATATGLAELIAALTGSGTPSATASGIGQLSADIVSFGALTVEGMREAVWSALASQYKASGTMGEKMNDAGSAANPWTETIDGTYTAAEVLRILAAVAAGKSTVSGGNVTFRDLNDTKDRVDATVSGGARTDVDLDAT